MVLLALILATAAFAELQTGRLPAHWRSNEWITHEYNADFWILRQPGSSHYEKPFLYLIFGKNRALLLDTGAGTPGTAAVILPLLKARGNPPLVVIHSHGHSDHTAGDGELKERKDIDVIPPAVDDLKKAFGIERWPDQTGAIDLGERVLDAIPIPGHDPVSIALYDRRTGILLTGDSLYPGRLYVRDLDAFRKSVDRLVTFTASRPVAHIPGTHIEQSRTPFVDYPQGSKEQPEEHVLELSRAHLLELQAALTTFTMDADSRLRDFTIVPVRPRK